MPASRWWTPRNTILDFVDADIVDEFKHDLQSRGIQLRLGEEVERVEKRADGSVVTYLKSGKKIRSDLLMAASGRMGATADLDLGRAGLSADDRGRLKVQPTYQTDVPHIYAVGDVIGFPALASTSAEQGRLAACHAFAAREESAPEYFPLGIYAVPEISIVGKTEQQLRKEGIPYETGVARLRETARGQIQGVQEGLLKLLFGLKDHKLLGAHIVGEGATELIHIGQAVLAHGGTLEYFVGAVFNYPTFAEAYKIAALDAWNRVRQRRSAFRRDRENRDLDSRGTGVAPEGCSSRAIPYHGGPFRLPGSPSMRFMKRLLLVCRGLLALIVLGLLGALHRPADADHAGSSASPSAVSRARTRRSPAGTVPALVVAAGRPAHDSGRRARQGRGLGRHAGVPRPARLAGRRAAARALLPGPRRPVHHGHPVHAQVRAGACSSASPSTRA